MIIAANFKTNHTRVSTKNYIGALSTFITDHAVKNTVMVFPPFTALDGYNTPASLIIGAQNGYPAKNGSFTGEIGTEQLDEFGIRTILLGHSERRTMGESDRFLGEKFAYFASLGYQIVYCIGESLEVREAGFEAVQRFLSEQLTHFDLGYANLVVAYEPIWAIGTGVTATVDQITQTLDFLRTSIDAPLLYGGSVKVDNCAEIYAIPNCDGVLVGTASWNVENFMTMIQKGE